MHIVDDEDIASMNLSKSDRIAYERIEIIERSDEAHGRAGRSAGGTAGQARCDRRGKSRSSRSGRSVKIFNETGLTPVELMRREGVERHRYLNGLDDV